MGAPELWRQRTNMQNDRSKSRLTSDLFTVLIVRLFRVFDYHEVCRDSEEFPFLFQSMITAMNDECLRPGEESDVVSLYTLITLMIISVFVSICNVLYTCGSLFES